MARITRDFVLRRLLGFEKSIFYSDPQHNELRESGLDYVPGNMLFARVPMASGGQARRLGGLRDFVP